MARTEAMLRAERKYHAKNRSKRNAESQKYMKARPEYAKKKMAEWKDANPDYFHAVQRQPKHRYRRLIHAAKNRNLSFSLTFEQYLCFTARPCTYCGFKFETAGSGLDRIDNSKGYENDNVTSCCKECNWARGASFTAEEMRSVLGPAIKQVKEARQAGAS